MKRGLNTLGKPRAKQSDIRDAISGRKGRALGLDDEDESSGLAKVGN